MTFTPHVIAVALIGLLHVFFAFGELFPWRSPRILEAVIKKWPKPLVLDSNGKNLMAMIVHNAGIYNGIVAAALVVTLLAGPEALPIQISLLIGGDCGWDLWCIDPLASDYRSGHSGRHRPRGCDRLTAVMQLHELQPCPAYPTGLTAEAALGFRGQATPTRFQ